MLRHHQQRLACADQGNAPCLPFGWLAGWVLGSLHAKCAAATLSLQAKPTLFSKPAALNRPTRASPRLCRSASLRPFGFRRAFRMAASWTCALQLRFGTQKAKWSRVAHRRHSSDLPLARCLHARRGGPAANSSHMSEAIPTSRFRRRHCAPRQLFLQARPTPSADVARSTDKVS